MSKCLRVKTFGGKASVCSEKASLGKSFCIKSLLCVKAPLCKSWTMSKRVCAKTSLYEKACVY